MWKGKDLPKNKPIYPTLFSFLPIVSIWLSNFLMSKEKIGALRCLFVAWKHSLRRDRALFCVSESWIVSASSSLVIVSKWLPSSKSFVLYNRQTDRANRAHPPDVESSHCGVCVCVFCLRLTTQHTHADKQGMFTKTATANLNYFKKIGFSIFFPPPQSILCSLSCFLDTIFDQISISWIVWIIILHKTTEKPLKSPWHSRASCVISSFACIIKGLDRNGKIPSSLS